MHNEELKVNKLVEGEDEEEEDSEEAEEGEQYQELATVLAFVLRNFHNREQTVVLRFK